MKSFQSKLFKDSFFLLFISIILFSFSFTSVSAQEVEDESGFDYQNGEKGPHRWGQLNKEWAACKSGAMQSPIDLSIERVKIVSRLGKMSRNYKPSNATVKNRGHDISIQWDSGKVGYVKINGTQYYLQQAHWHSPSEHTLNGRRYDMELHMVHLTEENVQNKIAVIGVLFRLGRPDAFLSKLMKDIVAMSDTKNHKHMGVIDPRDIKLGGKKYYTYIGSLTVPPCSEGVIWTINKKIKTVSREQVQQLRVAVHDHAEQNARPLQPINSRDVHLVRRRTPL